MSTTKQYSPEVTEREGAAGSGKKHYQPPAIEEEEIFESFAMTCTWNSSGGPDCFPSNGGTLQS